MFNIGLSELVVILLVALIFVGPKDLPKVGAYLGKTVRKFKSYIAEFKDETGLGEMEKEYQETVKDLKKTVKEADVTGEIREADREIRKTEKEIRDAVHDVQKQTDAAVRAAEDAIKED